MEVRHGWRTTRIEALEARVAALEDIVARVTGKSGLVQDYDKQWQALREGSKSGLDAAIAGLTEEGWQTERVPYRQRGDSQ